ncbi:MAG: nitroreductase family protein [Lachnospiraceae bacterium]|nr:nitroreductase family protein [Lachnospiraceae bacterium]
MDVKSCILGRRSIRKFKDTPIDEAVIREIVEEASYAPSWKHTQITRYVVIKDKDLKDKVGACTSQYPHNGEIMASAPALVAVTFIKNRSGFERDGSYTNDREWGWQMFDTGVASQTFCLACHEHGLGSVIMGIFDREKIEKLLELPEDRELVCLIPIGYPDEEPVAPKRKSVDDLLTII